MVIDRQLIDDARGGGEALDVLLTAIWPEAYRIACTILSDRDQAEDVAQEACATIARTLSTLKDGAAFRTWSYRIVANEAVTSVRDRKPVLSIETVPDRGVSFDRSDALDVHRALATLPLVQRAVVVLSYYCGFSSKEIGATLRMASPTVRFHLMQARRALQKALAPDGPLLARPKEVS